MKKIRLEKGAGEEVDEEDDAPILDSPDLVAGQPSLKHDPSLFQDREASKAVGPGDIEAELESSKVKERKIGMATIMTYYKPKSFAVFGVFVCVVSAFGFPMFGYLLSEIFFVLMRNPDDPEFNADRNFWLLVFSGYVIIFAAVGIL